MNLYGAAFPEEDLCVITVGEERAAYQKALEEQFAHSRALYAVSGMALEDTTRQDIEARYGAEVFRMEVINKALDFEYPALQADVCRRYGLVPLSEPEAHLLQESDDGYRAEVSFYTIPKVKLSGYTGQTLPAVGDALADAAAAQAVERSGYVLPQGLVAAALDQRRKSMVQRLREQIDGTAGQIKKAEGQGLGGETGPMRARKAALEQLLQQAENGEERFEENLLRAVTQDMRAAIGLYNVAWQENLVATEAEIDAEIERMIAISPQNAYARGNLSARQSIARRLTLKRTRAWLCKRNEAAVPQQT